jgi:ABC-type antimicrobial peptide transport system permease subunit
MIQTSDSLQEKPRLLRTIYADVQQRGLDREAGPQLILPFEEAAPSSFGLLMRFPSGIRPSIRDLEKSVWAVDSTLTIESASTLSRRLARQYEERLVQSGVFGGVSLVALILVSLCIYGLVWANVERSSGNLGIRIALGATPGHLRAQVLRNVILPWGSGSVAGAAIAAAIWAWMRSVLTELDKPALDLFALAAAVSLLTAMGAAWQGTRRIVTVDPAQTLRSM